MAKVTKNLSLDEVAVGRGERYSELHQTNLSRLVSDFLYRLPVEDPARQLSPTVSRLLGIARGKGESGKTGTYDDYRWNKYGKA